MSGAAAPAKPLKKFKRTWQTTFPEQHEAADALVDAWTEKWTVAKLKTLNKTEKTRRHQELVASVDKVLPDEWKTSELKRENFTAADSFVQNALSRWRRRKGQEACKKSKHAQVGGVRHDEKAHQKEQRLMCTLVMLQAQAHASTTCPRPEVRAMVEAPHRVSIDGVLAYIIVPPE